MSHVFVSNSDLDIQFVKLLISALAKAGIKTWAGSLIWGEEVSKSETNRGIEMSFALLAVVTPHTSVSDDMTDECAYAKAIGKPIIPVLVNLAPDQHPKLDGFKFNKNRNELKKLIVYLKELQQAAEEASRAIPAPDTNIQVLLGEIKHSNEDRRLAAIHQLGELGDPRATPLLMNLIGSRSADAKTTRYAYAALGQIACVAGMEFLLDELNRSHWLNSNNLSRCILIALPPDIAGRLGTRWPPHRARLSRTCEHYAVRINERFEEIHRDIVALTQSVNSTDAATLRARVTRIGEKFTQGSDAGEVLAAVCKLTGDTFDAQAFSNHQNGIVEALEAFIRASDTK